MQVFVNQRNTNAIRVMNVLGTSLVFGCAIVVVGCEKGSKYRDGTGSP
jgi:hypothetical protein